MIISHCEHGQELHSRWNANANLMEIRFASVNGRPSLDDLVALFNHKEAGELLEQLESLAEAYEAQRFGGSESTCSNGRWMLTHRHAALQFGFAAHDAMPRKLWRSFTIQQLHLFIATLIDIRDAMTVPVATQAMPAPEWVVWLAKMTEADRIALKRYHDIRRTPTGVAIDALIQTVNL